MILESGRRRSRTSLSYDRRRMRRLSGALLLVVVGCSAAAVETTTSVSTTTTAVVSATTTTTEPPVECPPAPYELDFLPVEVGHTTLDPDEIEPDVWTSVGGTQTTFWGREDGTVGIALVRGTLPPVDWPNEKGDAEVDGTPVVVGPHPDGTWVAGWFEQPEGRCDLYAMVFYPPVSPAEVEQVLEGMVRVAG